MALAAVAANAQNFGTQAWTDNLTSVETATNLVRSTPVAIDGDGNAIVSGSYDTDLTFGNELASLTANDKFIAKYDKDGKKLWATGLQGKTVIRAITTDSEGNIYVVGNYAETVSVLNIKGTAETITGMDDKSYGACFIVKYSKDGERLLLKTVVPTTNESVITNSEWWDLREPSFTPSQLKYSNGKLYLSVTYKDMAEIGGLTLEGKYELAFSMAVYDMTSASIIALDAATLGNAKEVVTLSAKEKMPDDAINTANDINFTVDGDVVYAGFVAQGTALILTAAGKEEALSFTNTGDAQQYGFIVTKIVGDNVTTKSYNSTGIETSMSWNLIDEMVYNDGKLYLAGTFNEPHPFDNTITCTKNCDIYVASLNADDLSKNWVAASGFDEGETNKTAEMVSGLAVNGSNVIVTGWAETTNKHVMNTPLTYVVDGTGTIRKGAETLVTALATNGTTVLTETDKDGVYTYTYYTDMPETGIKQLVKAEGISRSGDVISLDKAADIQVYAVNGALVKAAKNASSVSLADLTAGVYVVKAGSVSIKVAK